MPFILRKIRKAKWYKNENVPWLDEGELQADALVDLSTQSNTLSVWLIEDDLSNLQRVIAALSANQDNLSNVDYVLVDMEIMTETGFKFMLVAGDTPDEGANDWHRDLIELSTSRIVQFATLIQTTGRIDRILDKNILRFLASSIGQGFINRDQLKPAILTKLEKFL